MEKLSLTNAQNEALEMQRVINDGYASDYKKAERVVNNNYGKAPLEWQNFYNDFADVRKKIGEKLPSLGERAKKELFQKIDSQRREAFSSVNDPEQYLAYHMSIASSVGPIDSPKLDFEGKHSILNFYQKILEELSA